MAGQTDNVFNVDGLVKFADTVEEYFVERFVRNVDNTQDEIKNGVNRLTTYLKDKGCNTILITGLIHSQPVFVKLLKIFFSAVDDLQDDRGAGLSDVEIEYIPVGKVRQMESVKCTICLSHMKKGDRYRCMPCAHKLHMACIDQWLKVNGTCPLCRGEVRGAELDNWMWWWRGRMVRRVRRSRQQ